MADADKKPEKIEVAPETVTATETPYGYDDGAYHHDTPAPKAPLIVERKSLAVLSVLTAAPLPIIVAILWSSLSVHMDKMQEGFSGLAIGAIVLFLLLIFVVPLLSIFSLVTGYTAFRQSRKAARWLAVGSYVITAGGVVLLLYFIQALQNATTGGI